MNNNYPPPEAPDVYWEYPDEPQQIIKKYISAVDCTVRVSCTAIATDNKTEAKTIYLDILYINKVDKSFSLSANIPIDEEELAANIKNEAAADSWLLGIYVDAMQKHKDVMVMEDGNRLN